MTSASGPMSVAVETATTDDLSAMADLLGDLFTLEADFKPDRNKQLAGLRLILGNPTVGQLFVLRVDGCVAGMANALFTVSTAEGGRVLLLEDVIVTPTCRRQGLGRRLVDYVLAWATDQGVPRVTLLADKDNVAATAFYRRLGFDDSAMRVLRMNPATRPAG